MAGTGIMARICTFSYSSPYPIEKVRDSPYPYPNLVNAGIPRQNGDGFGQYPRGRVYLSSLDRGRYQRLVGKLIYLSYTRPNITYAVNVVSQFMHDPRKLHMDVVERILRYLKSTPKKGILFTNHGNLKVEGYTDADWAGSKDDKRSTSEYFTFVEGNLVTWRSKK